MRKKLIIFFEVVITLTILFLISYFLFNWVMNAMVHSKQEVTVPDVQNKSLVKAFDILSDKQLSIKKTGEEFSRDLPANTIIRQEPPPGAVVRRDRTVRVVISVGSELKMAPELKGKSLRDVEIELRRVNLTLGEMSKVYSIKYRKDEVVSQDPEPGAIIDKDSLINIVVSDGPPPEDIVLMPDFEGKQIDEAEKWADKNDLRVEAVRGEPDSKLAKGIILRQEPQADSEIVETTRIRFAVSPGPASGSAEEEKYFEYAVPQGSSVSEIKIILKDKKGEKTLFNGKQSPGTKIKVPYTTKTNARIRVFVNGILVEEEIIKTK